MKKIDVQLLVISIKKIKTTYLPMVFLLALSGCNAQDYKITFKVNMMSEQRPKTVGLKGNIAPLDWNKEYPMTDIDGDGIYETTITFNT
ncbi:MAG: hypothetical protein AAFZ89_07925, partial [Bacteroidota bacterium]